MEEIKALGKTIFIFILIVIYACLWVASVEYCKFHNRVPIWKTVLSRIFIGFHILAALIFFIWCWT